MAEKNDYISREAAKTAFCQYMGWTSGRVALASEVIFDNIPTADVRPVVFCRDCKHSSNLCHCAKLDIWTNEDDFCSKGVRRADNG